MEPPASECPPSAHSRLAGLHFDHLRPHLFALRPELIDAEAAVLSGLARTFSLLQDAPRLEGQGSLVYCAQEGQLLQQDGRGERLALPATPWQGVLTLPLDVAAAALSPERLWAHLLLAFGGFGPEPPRPQTAPAALAALAALAAPGVHLLSAPARLALATLDGLGGTGFVVGGAVRDALMGRAPLDIDLVCDLPAEALVEALTCYRFGHSYRYGVVFVDFAGEIHTVRLLGHAGALAEALRKNDFTVNALALDRHGVLYDPCGGLADLQARRLRCCAEARGTLEADPIRALRALRFSCSHRLELDGELAAALPLAAEGLRAASPVRLQRELGKLAALRPACQQAVLAQMAETRLLPAALSVLAEAGASWGMRPLRPEDLAEAQVCPCR